MTYPFPEPPSSVPDLMAELSRVKAAIRRTRKPVFPGGDEVTADDLFRLYARQRAVVRRLRCRYRQWRAEIGISDATTPEIGTVGTSGTAVSYKGVTLAPHSRISMEGERVVKSRLDADPGLDPSYDQAP
jgi:hypothetical protein